MSRLSAPVFRLGGYAELATENHYTRMNANQGELALTGPSNGSGGTNVPIRGDLAHIRLAGRFFVPHYAVPMPHSAMRDDVSLKTRGSAEADELCRLDLGERFDVLDIAGGWAWGQIAGEPPHENGLVGYIAMSDLKVAVQ